MKLIGRVIEAYKGRLSESDIERLEFFYGLWKIQQRHAEQAVAAQEYELADREKMLEWYWDEKPVLFSQPAKIDAEQLVASLEDCSCYLIDNAQFSENIREALCFFDWKNLVEKSDIALAGYDPVAYLDACCTLAENEDAEGPKLNPEIALLVVSYALRPMLQGVSEAIMNELAPVLKEENPNHLKPLTCPVCASKAIAAMVGTVPSTQGNGRMLYCGTCGCEWEFERIRCASCGTQNQNHLHYFHVEGDDAHRIYSCQECGDYTRTVFQEGTTSAFSFEVEDVIMAKLDMVANDPRFNAEEHARLN